MKSVTAHPLNGGVLWGLKGKDGLFSDIHVSVQLGNEQASHWPFLKPNLHTSFRPARVAVETADSQVVQERFDPRESFKGHVLETPWDDLQLAYFAGYAMRMLIAGSDRTINPELERWYAKRANSHTIEVPGASQAIYISIQRRSRQQSRTRRCGGAKSKALI